jgi:hypothetical protein
MRVGAALWPRAAADERAAFLSAIEAPFPDWTFERPADVTRCFASWC